MATRFELRHSPLTRLAILAAVVTEFTLFGALVTYGRTAIEPAAAFAGLLILASLTHAWFVLGSRYELTHSALRIVHGPWARTIALQDVLGALPLRTHDRGPTLQLRLAYGARLDLTPRDRIAFLDTLERRVAHLEVNAVEAATRPAA